MIKTGYRHSRLGGFSRLSVLVFASMLVQITMAGHSPADSTAQCRNVINVAGTYSCGGECIIRKGSGNTKLVKVSGEVDVLSKYAGATTGLYQNEITGSDNFKETEIGALAGRVIRTATAKVSDGEYPVLEEYVFDTDESCSALGYTKIVRNPSQDNFKTCNIYCKKDKR